MVLAFSFSLQIAFLSIRILPHHQNTGGFFVAAFEKVGPLPWESSKKKANTTGTDDATGDAASESSEGPPKKKRRPYGYREDPFVFFDKIEPLWTEIKDYYDMSEGESMRKHGLALFLS
jgi:hypothetical protein